MLPHEEHRKHPLPPHEKARHKPEPTHREIIERLKVVEDLLRQIEKRI
jgi:hypothetical protein